MTGLVLADIFMLHDGEGAAAALQLPAKRARVALIYCCSPVNWSAGESPCRSGLLSAWSLHIDVAAFRAARMKLDMAARRLASTRARSLCLSLAWILHGGALRHRRRSGCIRSVARQPAAADGASTCCSHCLLRCCQISLPDNARGRQMRGCALALELVSITLASKQAARVVGQFVCQICAFYWDQTSQGTLFGHYQRRDARGGRGKLVCYFANEMQTN